MYKRDIYTVLENKKIAKDVFLMVLEGDTQYITAPGQFINILVEGFYLRRPISICDWDDKTITIIYKVVGKGTEAMAEAIDSRTPYNANHVRNVAVYAGKMADYINELHEQGKEEAYFDANRREQLVLSALLHDLGKLVIPLNIMNKATRLEERIKDIEKRFETFRLKYKIRFLENKINEQEFLDEIAQLDEIWNLICDINASGFLPDDKYEQLQTVFKLSYQDEQETIPYFTIEEQEALRESAETLKSVLNKIEL